MKTTIRAMTHRAVASLFWVILTQTIFSGGVLGAVVPAPLVKWTGQGPEHAIIVDKSRQKVLVYHRDDAAEPVKVYRCSTGENSGPKSRRNDRKTPEGVYFFTRSHVQRDLAPIYGVRAFPIDYPNAFDRRFGRGGYGIWFHGTNKPLKPRDTNGCVVLENESIEDLARYIRLHETPVVIASRVEPIPRDVVSKDAGVLEALIEAWRRSWESKDVERYISFYSGDFRARGMDRNRWKAYKAALAKKYEQIRVQIDGLQLFRANGLTLAEFRQTYRTEGFVSHGRKRLYLVQNSEEYRIIGEVFDRRGPLLKVASAPSGALADIKRFVEAWRHAWESKDLKAYMGFYDRAFRSEKMDVSGWKRHKAKLNRKYRSLEIRISDLEVTKRSDSTVQVLFRQDYRSDQYRDVGLKQLTLVRRGEHWKIKTETWRPLTKGTTL